jgi:transposase
MRFDLSDEDWALLEPLLPKGRKSARVDDRKIMNAIFYVLRTGMPWRDMPARYGPYTTAYNRFNRWSRRGIWKRVFDQLASKSRDSLYLIDSTIVKAHRAASGAKRTYGPPRRQVAFDAGMNSLHKRIRPFGYAVGQDGDPRVPVLIRGTASKCHFTP